MNNFAAEVMYGILTALSQSGRIVRTAATFFRAGHHGNAMGGYLFIFMHDENQLQPLKPQLPLLAGVGCLSASLAEPAMAARVTLIFTLSAISRVTTVSVRPTIWRGDSLRELEL